MLTRDDLIEIGERYHREDWTGFEPTMAVFDIGRLMGHSSVQAERIAALEAELKASRGWWERLRVTEARIAALEAAARAVVDAVWSPSTNVYLAGSLICRICMSPDGRHSPSCPVSTLAVLLEEGHANVV
jgi:hypothetical protein